jgi:hypothetical protein
MREVGFDADLRARRRPCATIGVLDPAVPFLLFP